MGILKVSESRTAAATSCIALNPKPKKPKALTAKTQNPTPLTQGPSVRPRQTSNPDVRRLDGDLKGLLEEGCLGVRV